MLYYNITPMIFTLFALFSMFVGVGVCFSKTGRSTQRIFFIVTLLVWAALTFLFFRRQFYNFLDGEIMTGFLSNGVLLGGMLGFLSIAVYGGSVIFHKRFDVKKLILFLLPAGVSVALNVYFSWQQGFALNQMYPSWEAVIADISNPVVITRFIMLFVQLGYFGFMIYNVVYLVPVFNRYITETQANERYNMKWFYNYIVVLCSIAIVYFISAIALVYATQIMYSVIVTASFIMLYETVGMYKYLPSLADVKLVWTRAYGWQRIAESGVVVKISKKQSDRLFQMLERWMIQKRHFADVELSIRKLMADFPEYSNEVIMKVFENNGYSFQTYVREVRIKQAIKIIQESGNVHLRYKEIFHQVGFSHYSSFARAFTAVTGESPSRYVV